MKQNLEYNFSYFISEHFFFLKFYTIQQKSFFIEMLY